MNECPIKAHGPNLICMKLADQKHKRGGIHMAAKEPRAPRFRVLSVGPGMPTDTPPTYRVPLEFKVGDTILATAATEIMYSGNLYYIVSDASVIGTVIETLVQAVTMGEAASLLAH